MIKALQNKTYKMTMLLDFYGDLLTEKQRAYFDQYYNEDLSLSEIAENAGISRQGVRDMIVRAEAALLQYEEKTGMIRRLLEIQAIIPQVETQLEALKGQLATGERVEEILEKVRKIKG